MPASAVRSIGQLEMVQVVSDEKAGSGRIAHRRFVRTGEIFGDRIEILSGLEAGEQVLAVFADG